MMDKIDGVTPEEWAKSDKTLEVTHTDGTVGKWHEHRERVDGRMKAVWPPSVKDAELVAIKEPDK